MQFVLHGYAKKNLLCAFLQNDALAEILLFDCFVKQKEKYCIILFSGSRMKSGREPPHADDVLLKCFRRTAWRYTKR